MENVNFWLGVFANIFGITAAVFSVWNWFTLRAIKRMNQNVRVFLRLESGDERHELPLQMKRRDITRAELLGRLGMVPMRGDEQKRFKLKFTSTPEFITRINAVTDGETSVLEIPCSKKEYEQFEL